MHHVTQCYVKRIVPLDTQMNIDMKTVLIEEIESMANIIKEEVRKFNCGVD